MVQERNAHLLEVVRALRLPRRFSRRLNRGQQHRGENRQESANHKEFDERERRMSSTASCAELREHHDNKGKTVFIRSRMSF